jgi:hypothetical protein
VNATSVDRTPWVISTGDRPLTLEVVLLKQTLVLSWNQFLYAEGSDDEARIAFASHDVFVSGAGLSSLLQAIGLNQVTSIREPARSERFPVQTVRFIREIEIRRLDAD